MVHTIGSLGWAIEMQGLGLIHALLGTIKQVAWRGGLQLLRLQGISFVLLFFLLKEDTVSFVEGIECTLVFE